MAQQNQRTQSMRSDGLFMFRVGERQRMRNFVLLFPDGMSLKFETLEPMQAVIIENAKCGQIEMSWLEEEV